MKPTLASALIGLVLAAAPARAQLKLNLDGLAAKARESVDVSLDANMLQIAGKFLSAEKKDEAKAKELVSKLKGIQVRTFEFDKEGQYSQADLQPIRDQLKAPGWSRIVSVVEKNESVEIYLKTEGGQTAGLAILAAEPRELSIVSIVGSIDLEQLGALSGRFGIPSLPLETPKKKEVK
jgi:hypothetical protein